MLKYRGRKNRMPHAGIGDIFIGSVKKGTPEMRKTDRTLRHHPAKEGVPQAERHAYRFDDNACVLVDENNDPKGTEIKGPVAREVAERFAKIGSTATTIV